MDALRLTRSRKPVFSNWLLFSAMTETFLRYAEQPDWDPMRVDYAIKQHFQWYLGDGVFSDGPRLPLGLLQQLCNSAHALGYFAPCWR